MRYQVHACLSLTDSDSDYGDAMQTLNHCVIVPRVILGDLRHFRTIQREKVR